MNKLLVLPHAMLLLTLVVVWLFVLGTSKTTYGFVIVTTPTKTLGLTTASLVITQRLSGNEHSSFALPSTAVPLTSNSTDIGSSSNSKTIRFLKELSTKPQQYLDHKESRKEKHSEPTARSSPLSNSPALATSRSRHGKSDISERAIRNAVIFVGIRQRARRIVIKTVDIADIIVKNILEQIMSVVGSCVIAGFYFYTMTPVFVMSVVEKLKKLFRGSSTTTSVGASSPSNATESKSVISKD